MVLVLPRVTHRRWLGGMGALLLCGPARAGRGTPYGYDTCSFNGPHGRLTRVQEKTGTSSRRFPHPGDGEALGKAAAWTW